MKQLRVIDAVQLVLIVALVAVPILGRAQAPSIPPECKTLATSAAGKPTKLECGVPIVLGPGVKAHVVVNATDAAGVPAAPHTLLVVGPKLTSSTYDGKVAKFVYEDPAGIGSVSWSIVNPAP